MESLGIHAYSVGARDDIDFMMIRLLNSVSCLASEGSTS